MDGNGAPRDTRTFDGAGPIGYYVVYSGATDETLFVALLSDGVVVNRCDPQTLHGDNGYFCQFDRVSPGNYDIAAYIDGVLVQSLSISVLGSMPTVEQPNEPPTALARSNADSVPWRRRPTQREIERAFPPRALERRVSGEVLLSCEILGGGSVDCTVLQERPSGMGFGRAALRLSRSFEMNTELDNTSAVGRVIEIPVRFQAD